jgi:glutamate N-acetyltransferase/amino-acid N-acetyltransferase
MTTDTRVKMTQSVLEAAGRTCRVVGIAKGAGMIHPNMATMIAVIMTDAAASAPHLDRMLRGAVEKSFHRITVDGDTSTNDAVFLLASGQAGEFPAEDLGQAIEQVSRELAKMIVCDGEGASRLIRVQITGARDQAEALTVARTIASSLLVRTSVAGGDPNWGRIIAAAGRSGVDLDPERLALTVSGLPMFREGRPTQTPKRLLEAAYAADEVVLALDLAQGDAAEEFLTCDLTEQYVRVNAEYTS